MYTYVYVLAYAFALDRGLVTFRNLVGRDIRNRLAIDLCSPCVFDVGDIILFWHTLNTDQPIHLSTQFRARSETTLLRGVYLRHPGNLQPTMHHSNSCYARSLLHLTTLLFEQAGAAYDILYMHTHKSPLYATDKGTAIATISRKTLVHDSMSQPLH